MRPLLVLSAFQLFSDRIALAMPAALGVEVLHNFTLVHDDIMDEAKTRRGKKTVHELYGVNTAILAGDVMLIKSFERVMQSAPAGREREVMEALADASIKICEGQQLDMDFEERDRVATDEYVLMSTQKTAVLLGACLQIGALIAGQDTHVADQLYDAGIEMGRAFQIQDDILDSYGNEGATGKRRGGDILNSKKTYLFTTALEHIPAARQDNFITLYNSKPDNPEVKIQKVLKWFDEFGICPQAEERMNEQYENGVQIISSLDVPESRRLVVLDLLNSLKKRVS